jgi:magnesium chelatase subunit D
LRVARAAAADAGREALAEADLAFAARLVLAPRATCLPQVEPAQEQDSRDRPAHADDERSDQADAVERPPEDLIVAAALAALPPDLLALLRAEGGPRTLRSKAAGRAGQARASTRKGRPTGCKPGEPKGGARLDLLETLKAALPWQRLRRPPDCQPALRIAVRRDDFRVIRFRQRAQTTTVFAVDASGSSALHRLAEAKGAVELLLADCYVRRDQVALIGFRGRDAALLLPPTGSLLRARRCLAGLPGGGATPLAAGIDAAGVLADAERGKGRTPVIALLTDGRANVTRDGGSDRRKGEADAMESGRRLRLAGHTVLLVDTSPRPNPFARSLADEMHARYVPLPYADAGALSRAIRSAAAS